MGTNEDSLVARQLRAWGDLPAIVGDVFGIGDGNAIEEAIDRFCSEHLGRAVTADEFFDIGVGSVHGVRLEDGRRVLVKARRRQTSREHLAAAQGIQRQLVERGFPCPTPLVGPSTLAHGVGVAETWLDAGARGDPHEPELRRAMAATLARLVELCRQLEPEGLESASTTPLGRLWPEPHDARFDFDGTARGAEWIDAVVVRARSNLAGGGPTVIGHRDWRAENIRFTVGQVVAVYDWDSLGVLTEPELVGNAAHYFTSDFRVETRLQVPSLDDALAFVADYETARACPFSGEQTIAVRASIVTAMAYTARCEHSDALTDFGRQPAATEPSRQSIPDGTARAFLKQHAEELLTSRCRREDRPRARGAGSWRGTAATDGRSSRPG